MKAFLEGFEKRAAWYNPLTWGQPNKEEQTKSIESSIEQTKQDLNELKKKGYPDLTEADRARMKDLQFRLDNWEQRLKDEKKK